MNSNIIKICRLLLIAILIGICPGSAYGDVIEILPAEITYEINDDGTIKVKDAWNHHKEEATKQARRRKQITIYIDNKDQNKTIDPGGSVPFNIIAKERVWFVDNANKDGGRTTTLWEASKSLVEKNDIAAADSEGGKAKEPEKEGNKDEAGKKTTKIESDSAETKQKDNPDEEPSPTNHGGSYHDVQQQIEDHRFYGINAVHQYRKNVTDYVNGLDSAENKEQYLTDNDIEQFLINSNDSLNYWRMDSVIAATAKEFVNRADADTSNIKSISGTLSDRIGQRERAYKELEKAVEDAKSELKGTSILNGVINYAIIGVLVLGILMLVVVAMRRKKGKAKSSRAQQSARPLHDDSDNPVIVVRRRTTSILKKQCLDDVIANPEYLHIAASEFTQDSAVRNIYVKNSCIKEVYNMYAEDLRNVDNPKEDGCMVLGRWVYDENSHTYDVSMEHTIFPGDDAVFKEYELNFGGKIKLRVAEKLRKLRRDTNLQYDLVCWIHSHPGLGVFFSNSDVNVQMQLKHAQHPNFLIAFVIDILTSAQETGIFTFRNDGTMNSKGDLLKLYSLEEMYKWTLESEQASFNPANCYNVLGRSKMKMPSCRGIYLNNSSIIDLSQRVIEPLTGLIGRAVGTLSDVNGSKEYVVSRIARADERQGAGVIGVLLSVTHMSLPTIQRLIAGESGNIAFVMVYSSRQNTITSIPVINGELIMDEQFYGEETIDDLKIWTRRKR